MSLAVESSGSLGTCALEMFTYIAKALIQEMKDRCAGHCLGRELAESAVRYSRRQCRLYPLSTLPRVG